ncbi:MAG: OB-fold-containig protein [Erythrobacter sp.]
MSLLEAHNVPFAAALLLLAFIAVAQVIGLADMFEGGDADLDFDVDLPDGLDSGLDSGLDADFDASLAADSAANASADLDVDGSDAISASGFMDGLLSLLGLGRVPFLIWLASLLFVFACIGVSGQLLAENLLGAPLGATLAGLLAGGAAFPINGLAVRPIGAIMPKDQTSAISRDSLIRRDAVIQLGTARAGSPARSKVIDQFGQAHFVMVEPHDPNLALGEGETVLIVRRDGQTFYAMRYESPLLGPE